MSFLEHLQELRFRLLHAAVAIVLGFVICISFAKRLFDFLSAPLIELLPKDSSLVFTALPDPFFMYLKVSFVAGLFIAIPYVLYQVWKFIAPGLYLKERKLALPFVVAATVLFYVGAVFAYFVVFPVVFKFFLGFQSADLKPMISIKEYVSLIMKLMLAFGAIFETPIIIIFLGLLGIVDTALLKKGRRYFIVIAFVVGAILSPPDVISQILMGVPLLALYEVSIHILAAIEKRRTAREEEEAEVNSPEEAP
jgi:sec-independent protein translocase protein TatC